jgi:hypothetical protein
MGGRLAVLVSAWRYALETDRELIVDWNDFSYYEPWIGDLYTHFFAEPAVSLTALEDVAEASVWPPHWAGQLLRFRNDGRSEVMPYEMSRDAPPAIGNFDAESAEVVVVTRNSQPLPEADLYGALLLSP